MSSLFSTADNAAGDGVRPQIEEARTAIQPYLGARMPSKRAMDVATPPPSAAFPDPRATKAGVVPGAGVVDVEGNPRQTMDMANRPPLAAVADPRASKADFSPGPGAGVVGAQGNPMQTSATTALVPMSNGGNGGGAPARYLQSPHGRNVAVYNGGGPLPGRGRFLYEPLEFERDYYVALFRVVAAATVSMDPSTSQPATDDCDEIILSPLKAAQFLSTSGVPNERLRLIWTMAETAPAPGEDDTSKPPPLTPTMLTFPQFKVAVRLIQLYQNGAAAENERLQASPQRRLASPAIAAVSALVPEGPDGLTPAFFVGVSGGVVPFPAGLGLKTDQEHQKQQHRPLNPIQEDEGDEHKEENPAASDPAPPLPADQTQPSTTSKPPPAMAEALAEAMAEALQTLAPAPQSSNTAEPGEGGNVNEESTPPLPVVCVTRKGPEAPSKLPEPPRMRKLESAEQEKRIQREEGEKMRKLGELDGKGQQRHHVNDQWQHHRASSGNGIPSVAESGTVASAGNSREGRVMDAGPDLVPTVDVLMPLEGMALPFATENSSTLGSVGVAEPTDYKLKREMRGMEDKILLLTEAIVALTEAMGGFRGSFQSDQGKKANEKLDEGSNMDVEVYWRNRENENKNAKPEASSFGIGPSSLGIDIGNRIDQGKKAEEELDEESNVDVEVYWKNREDDDENAKPEASSLGIGKGNRSIARQTSQATPSLNKGTIKPKNIPPTQSDNAEDGGGGSAHRKNTPSILRQSALPSETILSPKQELTQNRSFSGAMSRNIPEFHPSAKNSAKSKDWIMHSARKRGSGNILSPSGRVQIGASHLGRSVVEGGQLKNSMQQRGSGRVPNQQFRNLVEKHKVEIATIAHEQRGDGEIVSSSRSAHFGRNNMMKGNARPTGEGSLEGPNYNPQGSRALLKSAQPHGGGNAARIANDSPRALSESPRPHGGGNAARIAKDRPRALSKSVQPHGGGNTARTTKDRSRVQSMSVQPHRGGNTARIIKDRPRALSTSVQSHGSGNAARITTDRPRAQSMRVQPHGGGNAAQITKDSLRQSVKLNESIAASSRHIVKTQTGETKVYKGNYVAPQSTKALDLQPLHPPPKSMHISNVRF